MVTMSHRRAEVQDRAVPGHWEGDLICGSHNRSAVGTLVERSTRHVMLLHLPDGHEAVQVELAMKEANRAMPAELFKTHTWDGGEEMARHTEIKIATGVQVSSAIPMPPGSADPTRTPPGCSANSGPAAQISTARAGPISPRSPDC